MLCIESMFLQFQCLRCAVLWNHFGRFDVHNFHCILTWFDFAWATAHQVSATAEHAHFCMNGCVFIVIFIDQDVRCDVSNIFELFLFDVLYCAGCTQSCAACDVLYFASCTQSCAAWMFALKTHEILKILFFFAASQS